MYSLYTHLVNGFLYMAMTDYPYSSSFLQPMPAWPVNASCSVFDNYTAANISKVPFYEQWALLKAASDIYFNYSG